MPRTGKAARGRSGVVYPAIVAGMRERRWTLADLAARAGVSTGHLCDVLHGRYGMPQPRWARKVAGALGLTVRDAFRQREEKTI